MEERYDPEAYVRKRLREIDDLDERKFIKEVLLGGLIPAIRHMEQQYASLEERIKREVEAQDEKYAVCTVVIRWEDYDPTNETLWPVCRWEEEPSNFVYFDGEYERKQAFEQVKELKAVDGEGKPRTVYIRRAACYRQAVEELYDVFVYNRIAWTTVNMGHLDRFYELYTLAGDEDLSGWQIDFGGMEEYVRSGMTALWNIERFTFQCRKFMVPCIDGKYYEHEMDLTDYRSGCSYMVGINEDILSIRYEKDKIIMVSPRESFRDWMAYRFAETVDRRAEGYDGEMLDNHRRSSFSESLSRRSGNSFTSRTELFRKVQSFRMDCVELVDCRVVQDEPLSCFQPDMNLFIREEIFPMETRRILELKFVKRRKSSVFCEDAVRFLVSQLQISLYEYKCVGTLCEEMA